MAMLCYKELEEYTSLLIGTKRYLDDANHYQNSVEKTRPAEKVNIGKSK